MLIIYLLVPGLLGLHNVLVSLGNVGLHILDVVFISCVNILYVLILGNLQ